MYMAYRTPFLQWEISSEQDNFAYLATTALEILTSLKVILCALFIFPPGCKKGTEI